MTVSCRTASTKANAFWIYGQVVMGVAMKCPCCTIVQVGLCQDQSSYCMLAITVVLPSRRWVYAYMVTKENQLIKYEISGYYKM